MRAPSAVLAFALAASPLASQDRGDFKWSKALAAGKTIEIIGVNGDIDTRGGSGAETTVTAIKRGHRDDPDEVKIEVVEDSDGITICAVYPTYRNRRPNECLAGGRGHNDVRDNDVHVHFTVTVGKGVNFIGRTVNGDVDASGLMAMAEGHSVNGSVRLETEGYGSATTVNGSILAKLGRADWSDELEFTTVNGRIDLTLPSSLNAEVRASSLNGGIDTDFPLTIRGRWGPRSMRGTIGNGGRSLILSTVNGSMEIKRGS